MTKEVNLDTGLKGRQITLAQANKPVTEKALTNGTNTPASADTVDQNPLKKIFFPLHILHEVSTNETRQQLKDFARLLDIPKDSTWTELKGRLLENLTSELPKRACSKEDELKDHLNQYKNKLIVRSRLLTKQIMYLILELQTSSNLQENTDLKLLKDGFLAKVKTSKILNENEKWAKEFLEVNSKQEGLIFKLVRNNHRLLSKALEEEDALLSANNGNIYEGSGLMKELRFIRDQYPEKIIELEKLAELKDISALENPNNLSFLLEDTEAKIFNLLDLAEDERNNLLQQIEKELLNTDSYKTEKLSREQICALTQKQVLYVCGRVFEEEESFVKQDIAEIEKRRIETEKVLIPKPRQRSLVKLLAVLGLVGALSLTSIYVLVNSFNGNNQEEVNRLKAKEAEELRAREIDNTKNKILSKIAPYLEINYAKYHEEAAKRLASKTYPSEPYDSTDLMEWTFQQRFVRYPLFRGGLNERYFRPLYVILAPSLTDEQKQDILSGKVQGMSPDYIKNFPDNLRTPPLFNPTEWKRLEIMLSDSVIKPISPYAMGHMMAYLEPPPRFSLKKNSEGKEYLQELTPENKVIPNLLAPLIKSGRIKAEEKEKYSEPKEYIKVDPFFQDVIPSHQLMQERILRKRDEVTKPYNDLAALANKLRTADNMEDVINTGKEINALVEAIEKNHPPESIRPALPYIADAEVILDELGIKLESRFNDVIKRNTYRAVLVEKNKKN